MRWAYGVEMMEEERRDCLLWKMYPCRCDKQFDARVEFAKSLINKLTGFIEAQIYSVDSQNYQHQQDERSEENNVFSHRH